MNDTDKHEIDEGHESSSSNSDFAATGSEADATDEAASSSIAVLQGELEQTRDRLLRTEAELDNFRKRSRREVDEILRYAAMPLVRELLPVLDNLDRAMESAESAENNSALLEGVKLVAGQLSDVLQRNHCVRIEASDGTEFDPNLHEAISQLPSSEHKAGEVITVTQKGYLLHDRVVRPAQVVVSTGQPDG